jgi:hypothetical protein
MKRVIIISNIILLALTLVGCIERDVLDKKEGTSLPAVQELKSSLQSGKDVNLQWIIPSEIPSEMQRPLSVYIQVYRGNTLEYQISLQNEPATWSYTLAEPNSKYRIVVKMQGLLKEKTQGISDEIYSPGQTVEVN